MTLTRYLCNALVRNCEIQPPSGDGVPVGVSVALGRCGVSLGVGVSVGSSVGVGVGVAVGVSVGVGVGVGTWMFRRR